MDWTGFFLLLGIGAAAGLMNAIAGGGSLLTVPALTALLGMNPREAIGSNRFTLIFLTATSSYRYWTLDQLRTDALVRLIPTVIPGAFLGALAVRAMNESLLRIAVGTISLLFLGFLFWKPALGTEEVQKEDRFWRTPALVTAGFLLGIYGGFYGAGVSTLFAFTMVFLLGSTMIQGIATAQVLALVISLAASVRFGLDGFIRYGDVVPLGIGMVAGAYLGPWIALRIGNRWIKVVFAIGVGLISLNLLFPGLLT